MSIKQNNDLILTGAKLAEMSIDDIQAVIDKLHYYEDKCHRLQTVNRSYVAQIRAYETFVASASELSKQ